MNTNTPTTPVEPLLKRCELAPRLRMTPDKVSELSRAGIIPCVRINQRVILYHWPTVIAHLTKGKR